MLVSEFPSIDMHCIVLPVKFDGGLSISVLRNKQLFKKKKKKKKMRKKEQNLKKLRVFSFQSPPFEKRTDLGKALLFWSSFFLCTGWTIELQI
jgi:hypothetical protein